MKLGIYKHSKTGNLYKVHYIAKHSESLEELVVYESLYENPKSKFWVRPLSNFLELVDIDDHKVQRFIFLRDN